MSRFTNCEIDAIKISAQTLCRLDAFFPDKRLALSVCDAGENTKQVCEKLCEIYGEEREVFVTQKEERHAITLSELKRVNADTIFIPPIDFKKSGRRDFSDLIQIMNILRGENGCKWDKAQTHESIKTNLIEEAYELCEAIELCDAEKMKEESGDVLLQAVFHACIGADAGVFTVRDVLDALCEKLISRHTHIFGQTQAQTAEEALKAWEEAKAKEKGYSSYSDKMEKVAKNLPRLLYAQKLQKIAAKAGICAQSEAQAKECALDSFNSFCALPSKETGGKLLFEIAEFFRQKGVDAESALGAFLDRFTQRFSAEEKAARKSLESQKDKEKQE